MTSITTKPDRLAIFCFLWAVATLIHLLGKGSLSSTVILSIVISAVIVLFRPRWILAFMAMLFFAAMKTLISLPDPPNHKMFELLLNLGMLFAFSAAIIPALLRNGFKAFSSIDRDRLYNSFAPMARISLVVLYFYVVLHKLNWDFLNPSISCATDLLYGIKDFGYTFIPDNRFMQLLSVWATLIFEAGIPVLLLFKKTRPWGILAGFGFHYILALHPDAGLLGFSTLMFTLYFFFTGPNFPEKLYETWQALVRGVGKVRKTVLWLSLVGIIAVAVIIAFANLNASLSSAKYFVWYIWGTFLVIAFVTVFLLNRYRDEDFKQVFYMPAKGLWIVPVLIFINGMSPYLGFKTECSFSMFSNLRTEGGKTNHIFIPVTFQLADFQQDLVDIQSTDHEFLKKYPGRQMITFFEFRRAVKLSKQKNYFVKYSRKGKVYDLQVANGIPNISEVKEPLPWWEVKLLAFRPIDKGPCKCKH